MPRLADAKKHTRVLVWRRTKTKLDQLKRSRRGSTMVQILDDAITAMAAQGPVAKR